MNDLRYPVGTHEVLAPVGPGSLEAAIRDIEHLPERLRLAVEDLSETQLDTTYRPGGWTVRQVVHHLADSHVNAYTRLRLALTEDIPTVRPYDERRWAELPDAKGLEIGPSLTLLTALHLRWSRLLAALSPQDLGRSLLHPDLGRFTVAQLVCLYGWHCRHHVAHITNLRARSGWSRPAA